MALEMIDGGRSVRDRATPTITWHKDLSGFSKIADSPPNYAFDRGNVYLDHGSEQRLG